MFKFILIAVLAFIGQSASAQLGLTKKEIIAKNGVAFEEVYKAPERRYIQYVKQKGDSKGLYQEMHEYSFGQDGKCNNMNIVTIRRNKKQWLQRFSSYEGGGTEWYDTKNHHIWSIIDDGKDGYIVITCSNGKL